MQAPQLFFFKETDVSYARKNVKLKFNNYLGFFFFVICNNIFYFSNMHTKINAYYNPKFLKKIKNKTQKMKLIRGSYFY